MASTITFTSKSSKERAEEKKQFLKEKFIELIIKVPLFRSLARNNLNSVADSFTEIKFNRKDVIIKEGEVGQTMYILKAGKVNIYKQILEENSKQKFIRTLEPPNYFGEYALLSNSPRTASVIVASESCSCYMLHKEALTCLYPANILMRCRKFLESKRVFEQNPVFNRLPALILSHLRDIMRPLIYAKGDIIVEKSTIANYMVCIIDGEITSCSDNEKILPLGDIHGIAHLIDGNCSGTENDVKSKDNIDHGSDAQHSENKYWDQTLKTISPTAICTTITLEDIKSCLGADYYPLFVRRARAYLYNLKKNKKCTNTNQGDGNLFVGHYPQTPSKPPPLLKVDSSCQLASLYKNLMDYLLHKASVTMEMKDLLSHVCWNNEKKAVYIIQKITKKILKMAPFDRNDTHVYFLKVLLRQVKWPYMLKPFIQDRNFYKHLLFTSVGKNATLYSNNEKLNNGNAYILLSGSINEIDVYGNVQNVYTAGDVFGTIALSSTGRRKFIAIANSKSRAVEIHKTTYNGMLNQCIVEKNRTKEVTKLSTYLKQHVTPFRQFENDIMIEFVSKCSTHTYLPGHVFNQIGDTLGSVYIILSGHVDINRTILIKGKHQNVVNNYTAKVTSIGQAQWFGLSAIECGLHEEEVAEESKFPSSIKNTNKTDNDAEITEKNILDNAHDNNDCSNDNFRKDVEVESHIASTKVEVLAIPSFLLQELPRNMLHSFKDDYIGRNSWRLIATENAIFCRRSDILRTLCQTDSLKSVVNSIMSGFEKNHSRPSSPRVIKNMVEESIRKYRAKPIPSAFEHMQQKRLENAMGKIHIRPKVLIDEFYRLPNGSFQLQHHCDVNNSTIKNKSRDKVASKIRKVPQCKHIRSKNNPSPRRVTLKAYNKKLDNQMLDLKLEKLERPEETVITKKCTGNDKNSVTQAKEVDVAQKMWKCNWRVGKPFKQKKTPMAMPEMVFRDNEQLKTKRQTLLGGAYNFV
jgi:CRP-like cAMP-binding protein